MVCPTKKVSASAPTSRPRSAVAPSDCGSGLVDLLFAASQVETKPKEAEGESGAGGKDKAEVFPFSRHDPEKPSHSLDADADAPKTKNFPQILHEILSTPECQSIAHWLPDGFSFIIADKQRLFDEILPKYFRQTLLVSFIRKLNRWGFRRIKSRCKGEESSFAHNHFIRDKPWLCMKMWCKSKPSYHKASSAKNRKKAQEAAVQVDNIPAKIDVVVPSQAPPSFVAGGGGGMVNARNRDFVPACLPTTSDSYTFTAVNATPVGPPTTAAVTTAIREMPFLASFRPEHPQQQRIFRESERRQFLIAQMRQDYYHLQDQAELQRLHHEMFSINDSYALRLLMEQYERVVLRTNIFYRG